MKPNMMLILAALAAYYLYTHQDNKPTTFVGPTQYPPDFVGPIWVDPTSRIGPLVGGYGTPPIVPVDDPAFPNNQYY